jgi:hypothetical protein
MDIWYAHLAKREVSQVLHDAAADAQKTKKGAKAEARPRCWKVTCRPADTDIMGSGWSVDSG